MLITFFPQKTQQLNKNTAIEIKKNIKKMSSKVQHESFQHPTLKNRSETSSYFPFVAHLTPP